MTEPSVPDSATNAQRPETAAGAQRPKTILVVDDNKDIVTVIRRILASQGYGVIEAFDGVEALAAARSQKPDIILLDWMMPGMDGLEVCRRLKEGADTRRIMILLLTGRSSTANRVEGFDAGADDYITKPFNHLELMARIRSALRIKELTDSLEESNRQLVASQYELISAEKMATIGLLASGIAHEFNNIMAGISGYAQLASSNPKYLGQLVDVVLTQTQRAVELTRSLSTYIRRKNDNTDCDVAGVVTSALLLVKKEIEERSITIDTAMAPGLPRAAIAPGQLQEIVLNLVINAIHAIHGSGNIRIEADMAAPGAVRLRVTDDGEGIPQEHLHRIFDPFFTTKGPLGGGKEHGTGLGLTVCYNVVQARGGKIDVRSVVGAGSTFTVTIPVSNGEAHAAVEDRPPATSRAERAPARPLRVLVVDDEDHMRRLLLEFLEGHEVVCCASGEDAVEEYRRKPCDYVVLDICMRDSINGIETLERLEAIDPAAKVIVSSGRLLDRIDPEVISRAHGHLLKPFKLEDLAALLHLEETAPLRR